LGVNRLIHIAQKASRPTPQHRLHLSYDRKRNFFRRFSPNIQAHRAVQARQKLSVWLAFRFQLSQQPIGLFARS
jgi:hypothetical protein